MRITTYLLFILVMSSGCGIYHNNKLRKSKIHTYKIKSYKSNNPNFQNEEAKIVDFTTTNKIYNCVTKEKLNISTDAKTIPISVRNVVKNKNLAQKVKRTSKYKNTYLTTNLSNTQYNGDTNRYNEEEINSIRKNDLDFHSVSKDKKKKRRNHFSWSNFWFLTLSTILLATLLGYPLVALFYILYLASYVISVPIYWWLKWKFPSLDAAWFNILYWLLFPPIMAYLGLIIFNILGLALFL